jgi:hypothetical protein
MKRQIPLAGVQIRATHVDLQKFEDRKNFSLGWGSSRKN